MATTLPIKAPSPLPRLLLLLSATTGLVDAASVIGLGKVFTANMTGNVVFLGFAAAGAPGFAVAPYLAALAAFMFGAIAGGRVGREAQPKPLRRWLMRAAVIEAALFAAAALVALRFDMAAQQPGWALFAIIALTAAAMGFRNATVRLFKVPDLTTTVLTLTITGLAADSRLAGGNDSNLSVRLAAIGSILAGAAVGALLVLNFGLAPPLLLAGGLIFFGTCVAARHPLTAQPHRP